VVDRIPYADIEAIVMAQAERVKRMQTQIPARPGEDAAPPSQSAESADVRSSDVFDFLVTEGGLTPDEAEAELRKRR
jgi:uncharacterized protein (DUF1786 family)